MNLLDELRRRGVVRAAAMYVAIAWGGTEILVFLVEAIWGGQNAAPFRRILALLFVAGFPVAMYLAWTRDLGYRARRLVAAGSIAVVLLALLVWVAPGSEHAEQQAAAPQPAVSGAPIRSLAVLPLTNLSGDPEQEYFALGMTEALIAELSRLRNLNVVSRTSVMRFRDSALSLPEIADQLGVDAVIEGSVIRSGDHVRVTAQLIESATDRHVWADTFDGPATDVLVVQREAARSIARSIGVSLGGPHGAAAPPRQVNPEAYDAYLKARVLGFGAAGDVAAAVEAAERAIELDPGFAPAHAFLSDLLGYVAMTANVSNGDAYLRARKHATRALELDPGNVYAHIALARVRLQFEWDWEAVADELDKALQLDSQDPAALNFYGYFRVLAYADCDGGLDLMRQARDRSPFDPNMHFDLGVYTFHCGLWDQSLAHLERANELAPGYTRARLISSWSLAARGDAEQASALCDALLEELGAGFDTMTVSSCAWVYHKSGRQDAADELFARLQKVPPDERGDPMWMTMACVAVEDQSCLVEQVEKAFRERSSNVVFMRISYPTASFRSLPRFEALMRQMKFPGWSPAGE